MHSVGAGASVAIISALAVNISLVPALLHTQIGNWMLKPNKCCSEICCSEHATPGRTKRARRGIDLRAGLENATGEELMRAHEDDFEHSPVVPLKIEEGIETEKIAKNEQT